MPVDIDGLTLYTVDEIAEKLDVAENTIRQYIKDGKLKGKKFGVKWFVPSGAIREYFEIDESPDADDGDAE